MTKHLAHLHQAVSGLRINITVPLGATGLVWTFDALEAAQAHAKGATVSEIEVKDERE